MLVRIEDALFDDAHAGDEAHNVELERLALLYCGWDGRHALIIEDATGAHPALDRWLSHQNEQLRAELSLIIQQGLHAATQGTSRTLYVQALHLRRSSDWEGSPPHVNARDAIAFLQTPLRVVLENARNDSAFLRAIMPDQERRNALEIWEQKRWIEYVQAGGCSEMEHLVRGMDARASLLHWCLFDSDAREPGDEPANNRKLREACEASNVKHHRLERREAENYISLTTLEALCEAPTGQGPRSRERAMFEAWCSLTPTQRHHFNMKEGFEGDTPKRSRPAAYMMRHWRLLHPRPSDARRRQTRRATYATRRTPFYGNLTEATWQQLRQGFGAEKLRKLFQRILGPLPVQEGTNAFDQRQLPSDPHDALPERMAIFNALLSLL